MGLCISITLFLSEHSFLVNKQWRGLCGMFFPGHRTGEGSGSLPLLPPWLRANSEVKVPSNPSLVKEVRITRSKSQVKRVYAYDMFIYSWFMLIAIWLILCGMLCLCLLGLGSWYLLVLKALQVSTSLMHDLGCRAVGFWKVEWCPTR